MLSMDPGQCWLLGLMQGVHSTARGVQCPSRCQGHVWVPINNADNKTNWGQAVAGFIDSKAKA